MSTGATSLTNLIDNIIKNHGGNEQELERLVENRYKSTFFGWIKRIFDRFSGMSDQIHAARLALKSREIRQLQARDDSTQKIQNLSAELDVAKKTIEADVRAQQQMQDELETLKNRQFKELQIKEQALKNLQEKLKESDLEIEKTSKVMQQQLQNTKNQLSESERQLKLEKEKNSQLQMTSDGYLGTVNTQKRQIDTSAKKIIELEAQLNAAKAEIEQNKSVQKQMRKELEKQKPTHNIPLSISPVSTPTSITGKSLFGGKDTADSLKNGEYCVKIENNKVIVYFGIVRKDADDKDELVTIRLKADTAEKTLNILQNLHILAFEKPIFITTSKTTGFKKPYFYVLGNAVYYQAAQLIRETVIKLDGKIYNSEDWGGIKAEIKKKYAPSPSLLPGELQLLDHYWLSAKKGEAPNTPFLKSVDELDPKRKIDYVNGKMNDKYAGINYSLLHSGSQQTHNTPSALLIPPSVQLPDYCLITWDKLPQTIIEKLNIIKKEILVSESSALVLFLKLIDCVKGDFTGYLSSDVVRQQGSKIGKFQIDEISQNYLYSVSIELLMKLQDNSPVIKSALLLQAAHHAIADGFLGGDMRIVRGVALDPSTKRKIPHVWNMYMDDSGKLYIIDFNREVPILEVNKSNAKQLKDYESLDRSYQEEFADVITSMKESLSKKIKIILHTECTKDLFCKKNNVTDLLENTAYIVRGNYAGFGVMMKMNGKLVEIDPADGKTIPVVTYWVRKYASTLTLFALGELPLNRETWSKNITTAFYYGYS